MSPGIEPEHLDVPVGRGDQPENQGDARRLAGAVGAEETVYPAALDFEVEVGKRQTATVTLRQTDAAQDDVISGH